MAQMQSTAPVAPSEKVPAAGRDLLSVRQWHLSSLMSFIALGDSQASKVAELPGFKGSYLSGEGFDCNRSDHDRVVALTQQEVDKASAEKLLRPTYSKK